jgi:Putative esterase
MPRFSIQACLAIATFALTVACFEAGQPAATSLRFEVTVADNLFDKPQDGRLLVLLGRSAKPEPRFRIGTGPGATVLLGVDVKGLTSGGSHVVDEKAMIFPVESLAKLPPGDYYAQAVFDVSRDLKLVNAPGNLYGDAVKISIKPAEGGTVKIGLARKAPPEEMPADTKDIKYIKLKSELLSKFHGRPMYLRAAVVLPREFEKDADKRYPLRIHIGGFGTRFTSVGFGKGAKDGKGAPADVPQFLLLQLDGAGPFGDPYQVNSANNGPYGDAVTQELIPHVEKAYRGIGQPYARVLDGGSTGGWVSLALQIFYPDFFNGAWSHAPDPVDFRAFELINIYDDANAYVNRRGFERPSSREINGDTRFTMRYEVQLERVLGRGDRWELGGRDWGSWNAAFGPRGDDGFPKPLWDGKTGKIDRSVLDHWKKYDLRLTLEQNWKTLGPKLRGKLHIWVGEADDFFLNNAVHLLDDFLSKSQPPYEGKITFGPRGGHGYRILSNQQLLSEMAGAVDRGASAKSSRE